MKLIQSMRKTLPVLLTALALLTALSGCGASPSGAASGETQQGSRDTASGTIRLGRSSSEEAAYPPEFPAAEDTPPLGGAEGSAQSGQDRASRTGDEVRAVWFSYFEMRELLTGCDEAQFRGNIGAALDNVRSIGCNTVFMQVRPYGDALYESRFFPWSSLATGTEGVDPGFDPLTVMVEEARKRNLRIEAWINPYRVRTDGKNELSAGNPAKKWEDAGSDAVIRYEGGLYYNPASEEARALIVDGAREIVERYDVDGIHFDDYFYPTDSPSFDNESYGAYKEAGGTQTLAAWRRENVNALVRDVYAAVKEADPEVLFGVSPQGNNDNNYNLQFVDTAKWLAGEGYVDYICPQIYFGFENGKLPFERTVREWDALIQNDAVRLYVGLAPYKIGLEDEWAGAGAAEWTEHDDMLARMVAAARGAEHYGGVAMFRYLSLFAPDSAVSAQAESEIAHLKEVFGA